MPTSLPARIAILIGILIGITLLCVQLIGPMHHPAYRVTQYAENGTVLHQYTVHVRVYHNPGEYYFHATGGTVRLSGTVSVEPIADTPAVVTVRKDFSPAGQYQSFFYPDSNSQLYTTHLKPTNQ